MLMIEPPPCARHQRAEHLGHLERAEQVHLDHAAERRRSAASCELMAAARAVGRLVDAGVVDEHGGRAEAVGDERARPPRSTRGSVMSQSNAQHGAPARCGQRRRTRATAARRQVERRHAGAGLEQRLHPDRAELAARPGDDGDLAVELERGRAHERASCGARLGQHVERQEVVLVQRLGRGPCRARCRARRAGCRRRATSSRCRRRVSTCPLGRSRATTRLLPILTIGARSLS